MLSVDAKCIYVAASLQLLSDVVRSVVVFSVVAVAVRSRAVLAPTQQNLCRTT